MKKWIKAKKIITMNPDLPYAVLMCLEGDRITYIGDSSSKSLAIDPLIDEVVDYSDKVLYPGFNDSHLHLIGFGSYLNTCRLEQIQSIADLIRHVSGYAETYTGAVLYGRNWNQDLFHEKRLPTKEDLDLACPSRPVVLYRTCGHIAVINSAAIKHFGITSQSSVPGGAIDTVNGDLTGILRENALNLVKQTVTLESLREDLIRAQQHLNRLGITSVQSDDLIMVPDDQQMALLTLMEELGRDGLLTVRVYEQSQFFTPARFKNALEGGYKQNEGNAYFKRGPLKILADGSLGARTARMHHGYADAPNERGILIHPVSELDALIHMASEHHIDVVAHGIGDFTIDYLIEAFKRTSSGHNAIVHCQITTDHAMTEMGNHHIGALVQPIFLEYDMDIVEDRVGPELAKTSYAFKTMLEKGILLGFGSDAPVEDPNPLKGIHYAVNRKRPDGRVLHVDEALTLEQAIRAYTLDAARFSHEAHEKGMLSTGYYADFVVFDHELSSDHLLDEKVIATYVGGKCVYTAD